MKKILFFFIFMLGVLTSNAANSNDNDIEAMVEMLLNKMTLEEKVRLSYAQSKFSSPGVPRLGVTEVYTSDGPHGVRMEINWNNWDHVGWTNDSCTAFPALTCLAATWQPQLASLYGKMVGEEARYRNKTVLLGPGVNLYRTPLNGRNFEYMGEDPYPRFANVRAIYSRASIKWCGMLRKALCAQRTGELPQSCGCTSI